MRIVVGVLFIEYYLEFKVWTRFGRFRNWTVANLAQLHLVEESRGRMHATPAHKRVKQRHVLA